MKAPNLTIEAPIPHPNIYGKSFCLDMLKNSTYYQDKYRGWSSAYTLKSILLQLQTFIFAENMQELIIIFILLILFIFIRYLYM